MAGTGRIIGDIVGPTGSVSHLKAAAETDEKESDAKGLRENSRTHVES